MQVGMHVSQRQSLSYQLTTMQPFTIATQLSKGLFMALSLSLQQKLAMVITKHLMCILAEERRHLQAKHPYSQTRHISGKYLSPRSHQARYYKKHLAALGVVTQRIRRHMCMLVGAFTVAACSYPLLPTHAQMPQLAGILLVPCILHTLRMCNYTYLLFVAHVAWLAWMSIITVGVAIISLALLRRHTPQAVAPIRICFRGSHVRLSADIYPITHPAGGNVVLTRVWNPYAWQRPAHLPRLNLSLGRLAPLCLCPQGHAFFAIVPVRL